jgi:hypothetical protein
MHDAAVVTDCVEISSGFSVFFGHGFVGADFADVHKFRVRCPMGRFRMVCLRFFSICDSTRTVFLAGALVHGFNGL